MNNSPYTLPEWLQLSAAIATVISSLAVIAYFAQIVITIKQFKRQTSISEQQFRMSEEHNRLVTQGYLLPEFDCNLYNPEYVDKPRTAEMLWNGLTISINLTNTGNIPVNFEIKQFEIYFDKIKKDELSREYSVKGAVYPNQKYHYRLANCFFRESKLPMSVAEIMAIDIIYYVLVEYRDFKSDRLKQIKRELKFVTTGVLVYSIYLNVEDAI